MRVPVAFALLMFVCAPLLHAADKDEGTQTTTYQAKERYRFNLGGPSGEYTDWERYDLEAFEGLTATINIEKTYGKPTDKWASSARINLFGPGTGKDRPVWSFVAIADRKDGHIEATIKRGVDKQPEGFEVKLAVGKPFTVNIVPQGAGKLIVVIDKATFEVPCDFEIKGLSALGSGVDVKFEPFNLLKRKVQ